MTITLPCLPRAQEPIVATAPMPAAARPFKILFIDDERGILRGYRRRFARAHDVAIADSGEAALRVLGERTDFDLVVCDLSMPDVNGMDVFNWVRSHAPALAERFVFATGGATQRDLERFLHGVTNEVLEKPFELQTIQDLIDRWRAK